MVLPLAIAGHVPAAGFTLQTTTCDDVFVAGGDNGSSMVSSGSATVPLPITRLVICVFSVSDMDVVDIMVPAAAGVPPTQTITASPISSVIPSTRSVGGTAALTEHTIPTIWKFAVWLAV